MNKRIQLTLFVEEPEAAAIEAIRRAYNPAQYQLIPCHVTLCREDELADMERILHNLDVLQQAPVTISFGSIVRFMEDKGVLMPAVGDNDSFHQLRKTILSGVVENPRRHMPHITLMHPRNATCTDSIFEALKKQALPRQLTFTSIALIEQEGGGKWQTLQVFEMKAG
jgi:2'-5' RNA ligase